MIAEKGAEMIAERCALISTGGRQRAPASVMREARSARGPEDIKTVSAAGWRGDQVIIE